MLWFLFFLLGPFRRQTPPAGCKIISDETWRPEIPEILEQDRILCSLLAIEEKKTPEDANLPG
jgi:hypothetical protein